MLAILDFGFWILDWAQRGHRVQGSGFRGAANASAIQNPKSKIQNLIAFFALSLTITSAGCTRTFWRGRADREVAYLVAEKSNNPRWALPAGFNLNM
ncbi:MAG TPA: hypothetical protein VFI31_28430, partial [Pirellulales bacterium]|nr:hypothetical protein [Pirellulales bacterium]